MSSNDTTNIEVLSMAKSRKNSALADVAIQLNFDSHQIAIADFRVLRNRQGVLWCSAPTHAISVGKSYEYHPTIVFSQALKRAIEDEIFKAYEVWEAENYTPTAITLAELAAREVRS